MPSHDILLDALFTDALPQGIAGKSDAEAAERFDLYRAEIYETLEELLEERFPVVQALVSREFFTAMARVFVENHPPASPDFRFWGKDFARFLKSFRPVQGLPYLTDVARLEFARHEAFFAPDAVPLTAEALEIILGSPERFTLPLHPGLQLLSSKFAVCEIWEAHQPGGSLGLDFHARGPESVLVLRDGTGAVQQWRLGAADALFVAQLLSSGKVPVSAARASAAQPGYDPMPMLMRLLVAGAFAEVDG